MLKVIKNKEKYCVFDIGTDKLVCLFFKIKDNKPYILGMDHQKSNGFLNNNEIDQTVFKIYPNPVNNYINIYSNNEISKIEIYDLFGKNLLMKQKENLNRLNATQLVSGVYIVKIFSRETIEIKRIIKK